MSRKFGRKKKIDKAVDDGLSGAVWALCSCCTGLFSLAGTAVKASGTDAQPDAAGSVLRGLGSSPTSRKSLSCHESPACSRRVGSKKIVQNLEELSIDFVRFLE